MRYFLLSTTMIGASVMLPMVDETKPSMSPPSEAIEVTSLDPIAADPEPAPVPAAADAVGGILAQNLPDLSGFEVAGLRAAGFGPLDAVAGFFRKAAAGPEDDAPRTELAAALPDTAAETPEPMPAINPLRDLPPEPDTVAGPADAMPPVLPVPALGVGDLAVLDLPTLDLTPGTLGMASLLPLDAIAALFRAGPTDAGDPEAAKPAGFGGAVTASVEADPVPGPLNVAYDPLGPVTEVVGSLTLDTPTPVSLRLESRGDPAPQPTPPVSAAIRVDTAPERPATEVATAPAKAAAGDEAKPTPRAAEVETLPAQASSARMIEVTANLLNLRAGPSSAHSVVIGLARGAKAEVIDTADNGWVRIKLPQSGRTGWAFGAYLTDTDGV